MPSPIRIAILECDTPLPRTAAKYGGYGGVFTALLHASAEKFGWDKSELHITTHHVVDDEKGTAGEEEAQELRKRYPRLEDIDAVLITGSRFNAFDNTKWVLQLVEYVKQILAQDRGVRIIGVCYGHQIVGRALGGEVKRSDGVDGGWEHIHQMHKDILPSMPPNPPSTTTTTTLLGTSPRCAIQGLYIPARVLTVQGHPEFTEEIVRELLEARRAQGIFGEEVFREAMGRVGEETDGVGVGVGFLRFLKG